LRSRLYLAGGFGWAVRPAEELEPLELLDPLDDPLLLDPLRLDPLLVELELVDPADVLSACRVTVADAGASVV
jgi:hypothetical protein